MLFDLLFFSLIFAAIIFLWIIYTRFFGAEWVKMPKRVRRAMLKILKLSKKDTFYDLGCGDAQLLLEASPKVKKAIGIEIDPLRFLIAKVRTRKVKNVEVIFGNLFSFKLRNKINQDKKNKVKIAVFLSQEANQKLAKKLKRENFHGLLASYKWPLPLKQESYDKKNDIFLYKFL